MVLTPEPALPPRRTGRCKAGLAGLVVVALTMPAPFASAALAADATPSPLAARALAPGLVLAPGAPRLLGADPADGAAKLTFAPPTDNGGDPALTYEASADAGDSWTPLVLTRLSNGSFRATLGGLDNSTEYSVVVHAVNSSGTVGADSNALQVTPAQVPQTPQPVSATGANGTADVVFHLPVSDGGSDITRYEYSANSGPWTTLAMQTLAGVDPATGRISGLTNGTTYAVRLRAVNAVGASLRSLPISATPHAVAPDAPTGLQAVSDNHSAHLTFTAPASDGGQPVDHYDVSTDGGQGWALLSSSQTGSTITGTVPALTNGTTYTLKVRAHNSVGDSAASLAGTVTPAPVKPGVPQMVSLTETDGGLTVTLHAPSDDGGSAVTGYQAVVTDVASPATPVGPFLVDMQHIGSDPTTPVLQIGPLVNGREYAVQVRAVNASSQHDGDLSAVLTQVPAGVPAAPVLVQGDAHSSDGAARIDFAAPDGNGRAVDSFEVSADDGVNPVLRQRVTSNSADGSNGVDVPGLTNGTPYAITITARNHEGDSVASGAVTVTPSRGPDAPTAVSLTPGNAELTVHLTAPTGAGTGGSAILGYRALVTDTSASTPVAVPVDVDLQHIGSDAGHPVLALTGLHNGHSYSVQVRAVNGSSQQYGDLAGAVTGTPATAPDAPLAPVVSPANGAVTLDVDAPFDGGDPIDGYTVTWVDSHAVPGSYTAGPGDFTVVDGHVTLTVPNLVNGTAYTFAIAASNALYGTGVASPLSASATPATLASAPRNVALTEGDGTIDVDLDLPVDDGGAPIVGYDVLLTDQTAGSALLPVHVTDPSVVQQLSPRLHVGGLANGHTYAVQVRAVNSSASPLGTLSVAQTATPAAAPDAPAVTGLVPGNGAVDVTFTVPADNGNAITSYVVDAWDGGSSPAVSQTFAAGSAGVVDSSHRSLRLSGLTNGTSYTFVVSARNAYGDGVSAASAAQTPFTVPGAPSVLVVAAHDAHTATLTITPPVLTGGRPVTGYTLQVGSGPVAPLSTTDNGDGTLSAVVGGLTPGATYTLAVQAVNDAGPSLGQASVQVTEDTVAPDAPTGLLATVGNGSAGLTFSAPAFDGGAAVTGYQVSTDDGVSWTSLTYSVTGSTVTGTVGGLDNGTEYAVRVRAVNGPGPLAASGASDAYLVTPATTPYPPALLSVRSDNGRAHVVLADPAFDGGAPITRYEASVDNGMNWQRLTIAPGPFEGTYAADVTGLTNDVTYGVRLRAVNSIGASAWSATKRVTPTAVRPAAPASLAVVADDRSAHLSFTAPDDGGQPVLRYEVSTDAGSTWAPLSTTGTVALTATVSGLTNGTAYGFTVRAVNSVGNGPASATAPGTPAPVVPAAPSGLVASPSDRSIHLSFAAPAYNGGSPVTGFEVSTDGTNWASLATVPDGSLLDATVRGLTNGTSYVLQVRATNAVGSGAAATSASATPGPIRPAAPRGLVALPDNGRAHLRFSPPAYDGGDEVVGYVYSLDGSSWNVLPTTPDGPAVTADLDNLVNGQPYVVRVRAVNGVGAGVATDGVTVTPGPVVPAAPTGLTATPDNGSAHLSFTAPASSGGRPVLGYEVSTDGGSWLPLDATTAGSAVTATVPGLSNGVLHTLAVRAVNAVGSGTDTASTTVTPMPVAPSQPWRLTTTADNHSVHLQFMEPVDNGGSALTGYQVSTDGGAHWAPLTVAQDGPVLSGTVSGLVNDTPVTVEVRALSDAGTSQASDPSVATPHAVLPGAPTGVVATAGDRVVHLAFAAPTSDGGSPITAYQVRLGSGDWSTVTTQGDELLTTDLVGLLNGSAYDVQVRAHTAVGDSEASATTHVALPVLVPQAPRSLVVTAGDRLAHLSFTAPSYDGGSAVLRYEATVDGLTWTTLTTSGSGPLTADLTGLANGRSYDLVVRAVNAAGAGGRVPGTVALPALAPQSVRNLVVTSGDALAHLSFSAPAYDGGATVRYEVSTDGAVWTGLTVTGEGSLSADLTGLTNGRSYTVRVRATNSAGSSAPVQGVVVPITRPDAPTALTATPQDGALVLRWTAPLSTGGSPIARYEVSTGGEYAPVTTTADGAGLMATVSGLSNGRSYPVSLRAVTTGGASTALTVTATPSAIAARYAQLGGASSFLGLATGPETAVAGGWSQRFAGGTLFWSSASGVHEVHGAILGRYLELGGPAGALGFPTSDERTGVDGAGRYGTFSGGATISWSPTTGVRSVSGATNTKWFALGGPGATLGYPTGDETVAADGVARYTRFSAGATVYVTANAGAVAVLGAIHALWAATGYEQGVLGAPTSDETATADGTGRVSRFTVSAVYWTPSTGVHSVRGDIYLHWVATGAESGPLGYPVTEELAGAAGSRYSDFTGGSLYWTQSTGAWAVRGAIRGQWLALGGAAGRLGAPTSDEYAFGTGRRSDFVGGSITWTPTAGLTVTFR